MTENEKLEIIEEVEKRLEEKYKGIISKEDVATVLAEPRNKWFRDPDVKSASVANKSPMVYAFGNSIVAWQVWEEIRKLTCRICGKHYVRQLEQSDHADEVCEKLCELVYELACEKRAEV